MGEGGKKGELPFRYFIDEVKLLSNPSPLSPLTIGKILI
jgi:hypothetical protein